MAEPSPDLDPVSVFSLLGDETRLSILKALYGETPSGGTGRGAVAYSTLQEAVGEPDSGKFNYHLSKLTGHFVEKLPNGYALREPGKEVVRALRGGTITRAPTFDPVETDASCPQCGGAVRVSYANEHVFAHCTDCVGLLEFEYVPDGTLLAVTFPPTGVTARGLSTVLEPATLRFEHRLQMMADGLCPRCGGSVGATVHECPDHRNPESSLCDRCHTAFDVLVELRCETCDRRRIAPPAFACTHRDPIAEALTDAGVDGGAWDRYTAITRWTVWVRGEGDRRQIVYVHDLKRARIVVDTDLRVIRTSPVPSGGPDARLDE